jgi:MFS family permease
MREVVGSRRHQQAFWIVSFAFLAAMAFSAVPSPLYGLYRARDHFSVFMVTVAYAVYAVGVLGALLLAGHLSDWFGRRRLLLPALGAAIASAIVFVVSKSLAGLLVGRVLNGIAIGIVVSTATAYLAELHAVGRPDATPRRAQLTAAAIPVGGIGLGALIAGVLAEWVAYRTASRCHETTAACSSPQHSAPLWPSPRSASSPAWSPYSWRSRCIIRLTRSREPSCLPYMRRLLARRF